LNKNNLALKAF